MAEPASAILSFVLAGRATWNRIDKVLTTIKNAPVFIEDLKVEGGVLSASLAVMEERIRDRRNNLTGPKQDFYRAITPLTNRFKDILEEFERTLLTQRSGNKYWHCFKLQRKLDRQLKERLSRNIEIFHLIASLLRMCIGISDGNHKGLDESEQSDFNECKEAPNAFAFATYQQVLSGPAVADNPQSVPPNMSSSNGVSRRPSGVISPDELLSPREHTKKLRDSLLKENPELRDKQEKVGILCASLHDYDGAIDLLRLSLDTYLPDAHLSNTYLPNHDSNKYKIKQISMLVAEQYERSNQSIELLAFKEALLDSLTYDPTSEPNAVNNTIEWCRQHKFQAMKRDECLYIPEEYLANSTPLHRAAADIHIQPEVIH
ncbi:hypothetical protein HYE67_006392 [Fusarium culmorum]|uniref:Fungal N-terminal domain-containing protein n=1 Tax=Fusarium culmorum TaxID=5516 RepID=A0A7S8D930_FUSCU|nr:hypothetical protein HYE67_006392 [Fusarium culmorum]